MINKILDFFKNKKIKIGEVSFLKIKEKGSKLVVVLFSVG
jgi:hypothetical protein